MHSVYVEGDTMAQNTATFTGTAADGTALTAIYLVQPDANVAIGLVAAGDDRRVSFIGVAR